METIQKLIDKRASLWHEIKGLESDLVQGKFTPELDEKFERMDKEYQRLDKQIKANEMAAAEDARAAAAAGTTLPNASQKDETELRKEVFAKWMRKGMGGLSPVEQDMMQNYKNAAQQTITTSGGGYIIPEDFSGQVSETMKYYGPFSPVQGVGPGLKIYTSSGAALPWPTIDDTAQSGQNLGINTDATTSSTALSFGVKTLGAVVTTSDLIQVPKQLLQDEGVNFEALLANLLGKRIGRRFNNKVTKDDGEAGEYTKGMYYGATQGKVTAATTAITSAEIIDLFYSVDLDYRNSQGAGFMMNDVIAGYIRKLTVTSSADQYLWQPSFTEGQPDKLLGKSVWINNDLDSTITADKRTIFFGDFDQLAIRIVRGMELQRFDERFAEKYQVGWMATMRADCEVLQSGAIKYLRQLNT